MPVVIALAWISAASMVVLALIVWRRRPPPPLWPALLWFYVALSLWSIGGCMAELIIVRPEAYWPWTVVVYSGVILLPPTWWLCAIRFSAWQGHPIRWAGPAVQFAPLFLAAAFWLIMLTNPWHGLFIEARFHERNVYKVLWYGHWMLSYGLMIAILAAFARLRWRMRHEVHNGHVTILFLASAVPFAANALYVITDIKFPVDPTIIAMSVSGVLFYTGMYRRQLFALSPVTLETIVDHDPAAEEAIERLRDALH